MVDRLQEVKEVYEALCRYPERSDLTFMDIHWYMTPYFYREVTTIDPNKTLYFWHTEFDLFIPYTIAKIYYEHNIRGI